MQIKEIEIGLNKGLYGNAHKSPAVEIRFLLAEIATLTNENKQQAGEIETLSREIKGLNYKDVVEMKKKDNISQMYPGWPPADIPDGPYTGTPNDED